MTYGFVNEKIIDGKTYTILRSTKDPKDEVLMCNGKGVSVKIKDIWNSKTKIKKIKLK